MPGSVIMRWQTNKITPNAVKSVARDKNREGSATEIDIDKEFIQIYLKWCSKVGYKTFYEKNSMKTI